MPPISALLASSRAMCSYPFEEVLCQGGHDSRLLSISGSGLDVLRNVSSSATHATHALFKILPRPHPRPNQDQRFPSASLSHSTLVLCVRTWYSCTRDHATTHGCTVALDDSLHFRAVGASCGSPRPPSANQRGPTTLLRVFGNRQHHRGLRQGYSSGDAHRLQAQVSAGEFDPSGRPCSAHCGFPLQPIAHTKNVVLRASSFELDQRRLQFQLERAFTSC